MKKIYSFLLILFSTINLFSQSKRPNIVAVELPDSHFQFVNVNSRIKVNNLVWDEAESFFNGFAKVSFNHKWGFVDGLGNPVVKTNYESVRNFVNKLAAVKLNSKWGFIDEKGNVVVPFEYDIAYDFIEAVTAVYKNKKWFLMNRYGKIIKPLSIEIFWGFNNGIAKITSQGRSGIMNIKGEVISLEPLKNTPSKNTNSKSLRSTSVQTNVCPANIDFEFGNFTNWVCDTGLVSSVGTTNVITVIPSPPTPNRQVIIPKVNPSLLDPYGLFPTNPPNGSNFAVRLGNNINGRLAERVSYLVNVPANAVNFYISYQYAVVFQDPGHLPYQQPRFLAQVLDVATNTYLPCASYEYVSGSGLPGFFNSPLDTSVKCKSWSTAFINLSAYAGKALLLDFTAADCTLGAHWGYAYLDVDGCNIAATAQFSCNPNQLALTSPPGFQFYNWYNNNYDTLLGTSQNTVLSSPSAPGSTLHVVLVPYNGFGCSDTIDVPYSVNLPVANAGPDVTICGSMSSKIGGSPVNGYSYTWTPATFLSNPDSINPIANPPVSTTYIITALDTASGCTAEDSVTVNVNPKPVVSFNLGPAQCLTGNSFTFANTSTVSSGNLTYNWSFGDGDSTTTASPVHIYKSPGSYSVKLIATSNNGCTDSVTDPAVTVNGNPIVKTSDDLSICRGAGTQLQTTGALTYDWTPSTGLSCITCANPTATPVTTNTYFVKGIDSNGCPGFDSINITVYQPIQINVSPNITICDLQTVNLLASGNAFSYVWSPAQGLNNDSISNPLASPDSTTQYRVIGYDDHNCFTDTGYVTITVNPKPTIYIGPDQTLTTGTIYPLHPITQNGPIVSWQWSPPTNLSCTTCPDPSATVTNDITYSATISNIYGCTATDSIQIRTICEGSQVFIPNAFTPDGDGKNDILMVRAKGIESVKSFRIFSRWGELIFEKTNFPPNDPAYGWDGKIRGVTGPAEVYVYTAEVICTNLQTYMFKGNTTLLK